MLYSNYIFKLYIMDASRDWLVVVIKSVDVRRYETSNEKSVREIGSHLSVDHSREYHAKII